MKLSTCMAVALVAALAANAWADEAGWRQQCPGAAAWNDTHADESPQAMQQRDGARRLTQPELLAELQARVNADQDMRRQYLANRQSRVALQAAQRTDADNFAWLSRRMARDGLPTLEQVGEYGLHLVWLLVHHADAHPAFQQQALEELQRRHAAGGFNSADLARLTDRVRVKQHAPQPYGTQHDWGAGTLDTQPVGDVTTIDANRSALGLMPLADYGCMMHALRKPPGAN
ncbi:DUF6624 domain-containing protein [Roseateles sp.]|uniref:DUF6624 domain-containing protein n=1 Tax=Roseateles sp. TaxID=1971397 RepID=UPI0032644726